jgi:hypothetical protein
MVDTLLHLESHERVLALFGAVHAALESGGKLIITLRDLSHELAELDRFVAVKSDENTIFTCFLEYEPQTVKVHDLVYRRQNGQWAFKKSFYRKLRLSPQWVTDRLRDAGFGNVQVDTSAGFATIVAAKSRPSG